MDASRSDPAYLYEVIEAVISAGAGTVNIPDTVGYAIPQEFGKLIRGIREQVPNSGKAVISVHCHNDLGLAVANSLAAVVEGAGQVECTINGIGERAGNTSLEEIAMGLRTRKDLYQADTKIHTEEISKTSRLVSKITGMLKKKSSYVMAILGATGAVGKETLEILEERKFPISKLRLFASKRSAGEVLTCQGKEWTVEELTPESSFAGVDIALISATDAISREFGERLGQLGVIVIDDSGVFRMDVNVPLVVPEVNVQALSVIPRGIVSIPNCTTTPLVMSVFWKRSRIVR